MVGRDFFAGGGLFEGVAGFNRPAGGKLNKFLN